MIKPFRLNFNGLPDLSPVISIDLDIIIGDVAAPAGACTVSLTHGDGNRHIVFRQDSFGGLFVKVQPPSLGTDGNAARRTDKGYVHLVRIKASPE